MRKRGAGRSVAEQMESINGVQTAEEQRSLKIRSYLLMLVLAIMWGSSFILMKRGLLVYTPVQIGALRVFIAALALLPFVIRSVRNVPKNKWKFLAASGFLGNGIPAILFPLAETQISSAVAGMMNSLTPVFTLIVGISIFGMKAGRDRLLGLFAGLAGAYILITSGSGSVFEINKYSLLIVISTVFYAFSVNILRYRLSELDPVTNTGCALMCSGFPMGILLFSSTDFIQRSVTHDDALFAMGCIILLGLMSTAFSTVLFNRLIKISGALTASSVTYLIPAFAMLWGVADGESLSWIHLAGLAGILLGVWLINRRKG